jgi:hypothetical protein
MLHLFVDVIRPCAAVRDWHTIALLIKRTALYHATFDATICGADDTL